MGMQALENPSPSAQRARKEKETKIAGRMSELNKAKADNKQADATWLPLSKKFENAQRQQALAEKEAKKAALHERMLRHRYEWGCTNAICKVIPVGSDDVSACVDACANSRDAFGATLRATTNTCGGFNVVPIHQPSNAQFAPTIPSVCAEFDEVKAAKPGDRLCFGLARGADNDGGPAADIAPNDPEDPAFYSTCFQRLDGGGTEFTGETCGDACFVETNNAVEARWRFGEGCMNCVHAQKATTLSTSVAPEWVMAAECQTCNAQDKPVPGDSNNSGGSSVSVCKRFCRQRIRKKNDSWDVVCGVELCKGCTECK